MKIKDLENNKKTLFDEVRYNKNTKGKPISVTEGKVSKEKKNLGSISILGIMNVMGYFDEARREVSNGNFSSIIEKMAENSNLLINNKEIKL